MKHARENNRRARQGRSCRGRSVEHSLRNSSRPHLVHPVVGMPLAICVCFIFLHAISFAADKCYTCHSALADKPSIRFKKDVHYAKGIGCSDCHGGNGTSEDMAVAMDTSKGFLGVPHGDTISKICATCHSDGERMKSFGSSLPTNQWAMLQSSAHGKLGLNGKDHIAQCTTCHNAHGIVSTKNLTSPVHPLNVVQTCATCHANASFMGAYNPSMPVDQLEKYRTSKHGILNAKGDAKTAECASCHGSHDIRSAKDLKSNVYATNIPATCSRCHSDAEYMRSYNIPSDQFEKYAKSVHGKALLGKHDLGAPACNNCHGNHGAIPPGVESISKVCGTCHALNADLFSASAHQQAFAELQLPECETCHGNHDIIAATNELLGTTPEAVCSQCHGEGDASKGFQVAYTMRLLTDSLESGEVLARSLVDEAEQKGMEMSEAKFKLREARQARLQSRTAVHSFDIQKFSEVINKGLSTTTSVHHEATNAIDEYSFRRTGLGIATFIITILAVSLYLLIRRIERQQRLHTIASSHTEKTPTDKNRR